jgi:hypothetical protein
MAGQTNSRHDGPRPEEDDDISRRRLWYNSIILCEDKTRRWRSSGHMHACNTNMITTSSSTLPPRRRLRPAEPVLHCCDTRKRTMNRNVLVFLFLAMRLHAKDSCGTVTAFVLYQGTEAAFERMPRTTTTRLRTGMVRIMSNSICDDSQQQIRRTSSMYHRFSMVGDTSEAAMQYPADKAGAEEEEEESTASRTGVVTKLPLHIAFVCNNGDCRWPPVTPRGPID